MYRLDVDEEELEATQYSSEIKSPPNELFLRI